MSEELPLSEAELKIVQSAKRSMVILAKIIRDKDVKRVVEDPDLKKSIGKMTLDEALADKELGPKIRERITPDLPLLNVEQEAQVICGLSSTIFGWLLDAEK